MPSETKPDDILDRIAESLGEVACQVLWPGYTLKMDVAGFGDDPKTYRPYAIRIAIALKDAGLRGMVEYLDKCCWADDEDTEEIRHILAHAAGEGEQGANSSDSS